MSGRADISAGRAFVELYVKSGSLAHGLADARRRLHDFGTSAALVGAAITAAGTAIVAPISAAINKFVSMGSELNDMAQRTGVAASALAELKFAAEQSGAALSDVEVAIRNVQKNVTAAAAGSNSARESLAALGLTAGQLRGKLPEQQLQMIADRLAAIKDPGKRASAAMDVLGKSGAQLLPMVASLAALRAEARRLGIVPTDKAIADAAVISNLFAAIKSVAFSAVFEIGSAVGPILTPMLETVRDIGAAFNRWARDNGDIVRMVAKIGVSIVAAGMAVTAFGGALMIAARGMGFLQVGLRLFTPFIAPITLATKALKVIRDVTSSVGDLAGRAFRGMTTAIGQTAVRVSSFIGSVASAGWRMAGGIASAAMSAGRSLFNGIYNQVSRLVAQVPAAFNRMLAAARSTLSAAATAAAGFGREASYWLARPWQYFATIAPQAAGRMVALLSTAVNAVRTGAGNAANWVQQAWSRSLSVVSTAVGAATAYIAARWATVANPVTARIMQAWTAMSSAVSSRVGQAWNTIATKASEVANRIKTFLGPVLPMIQADFGKIAGYARTGFTAVVGIARVAAGQVVAAFRFAGPAIARGLTTAISGALSRVGSMGAAAAGGLARGLGSGMRGLSGVMSGGAGLLSMMGAGAGGMLGELAGVVPQLLMIGSSLGMLLNPATLLIGAIAGGVYIWGRYSASGRAAMASVAAAFSPFVEIAKKTFGGVYDAIKAGDLALAGQVAMAGLKLSFITGMAALGDAIGGTWGSAISDIGTKMMGGDFAGAWSTAVKGMAAVWDAWSEGVVKTFTGAISTVVDKWKQGVGMISDFLLEASAKGGALGKMASGILGVDMRKEGDRKGVEWELQQRNLQRMVEQHKAEIAKAEAKGDTATAEKQRRGLANTEAELAKGGFQKPGMNILDEAKQDARNIVAGTADAIDKVLRDIDRDAEAKTQASNDDLAASLPKENKTSDAVAKAQAELDALTKKAAEAKAKAEKEKADRERENFNPDGIGDIITETKNVAGSFSAAALQAIGNGADPQLNELRIIKGNIHELVKLEREQLKVKQADALEFVA